MLCITTVVLCSYCVPTYLHRALQLKAIADGRVQLCDEIVPSDTVIRNGDYILHYIHRHEPPVLDTPINIALDTEDTVRLAWRRYSGRLAKAHAVMFCSLSCPSPAPCPCTRAAATG